MMNARPSSIGEILDRAIAIYLPRCVPLFIIFAVVALPLAIVENLSAPGLGITHTIDLFRQLVLVPPGHPAETQRIMREFSANSGSTAAVFFFNLGQNVLTALAMTALTVFAAAAIDGTEMSIGAAYRAAVRRWIPQIVVGCAFIAFMIAAGFVFVFIGLVGVLTLAGIALIASAVSTIVGIIGGIVLSIAFVLTFGLLALAWTMAGISVAIEEPNPFRAIGRGLRRTLVRPLLRRSIAAGAALLALVWFGTAVLLTFGGGLALLTRLDVLAPIVAAGGAAVINGVAVIYIMLYMRDVKVRREGSDLLAAIGEAPLPA